MSHLTPLRMAAFLFPLLLLSVAQANDDALVKRLEELGGQITRTDGLVTQLMFKDCSKLGRVEFEQIGQLKSLKRLTLYVKCNGLTDETLPLLAGLANLEELSTDGIMVSDAGLKPLGELKNLRSAAFFHISFGGPKFSGAGFAHLAELPKLRRLTVAGSPFNDEGLAAMAKLPALEELRTWHTWQTPAGNAEIGKLKNLKTLYFGQRLRRYDGGSNALTVSDEALAPLAGLTALESLTLDEARLTYAGLARFAELPNLKKLSLQRCDIPAADLEKLRAALPKVMVEWKPLTDEERPRLEAILRQ
ncbi:MAG: hypothetical protein SFU86_20910 [Pirellulaceae bacterium]|nr:hypothetical protein [Pirellulaceae bacterium]